ncbi:PLP-dependent aminotransferase family protein [Dyella choica]|uniref:PLP-dependent aminotransferase family protein n=1 Tax=Dyella choica TaxID=1927959 RepID=A0A3S0R0F1_9GAMM|nr:PLP-dependent aminotransferase family protein [Dyella choica]RUL69269.1 PLP-dependent aminotransferase family protein [Dyella choica]
MTAIMQTYSHAAVMNFLNEVSGNFPDAIALAAGRPTERYFGRLSSDALREAIDHYGCSTTQLLQYGRTAGVINTLVATQLRRDEGVPADANRLIITAGCQEAIALCLSALCPRPDDVALVCNPTYIGATGAAQACGVAIKAIPSAGDDLITALEQCIEQLRLERRCPRVLYLIPDFDNPTGRTLSEVQRRAVLTTCERHRIVILEDNPYGMFRYEGSPIPPMAALDEAGCVIYLSTYSKTICPAVRVGSACLPHTLFGDRQASAKLFQELTERKSFVSVNTSPITQAIVGGILLRHDCSLRDWIRPTVDLYADNREVMLQALKKQFEPHPDISWNRPDGGFFLSMDLPFRFTADAVVECATRFQVIVMPLAFFALDDSQDRRIRLAFSAVDRDDIASGVASLSRYVTQRLESMGTRERESPVAASAL